MLRQYHAQHRRRGGSNPLGVGVIGTGAVYYLQDRGFFSSSARSSATLRTPWVVEGFLNGTMGASRRNPDTGLWESTCVSGRSDMAVVRSLRDGRRETVSVQLLGLHEDLGLALGARDGPGDRGAGPDRRRQARAGQARRAREVASPGQPRPVVPAPPPGPPIIPPWRRKLWLP